MAEKLAGLHTDDHERFKELTARRKELEEEMKAVKEEMGTLRWNK